MERKMIKEKQMWKSETSALKASERMGKVWKSGYIQVFILAWFAAMLSFSALLIRGNGIFTLGNDLRQIMKGRKPENSFLPSLFCSN